jgi:predicted DCC family thiol-disulfide oxidoreductase YuxK
MSTAAREGTAETGTGIAGAAISGAAPRPARMATGGRPRLINLVADRWSAGYEAITTRRFASRGSAVLRMGYGGVWTLFLLREYGERDAAWGPDSAWSPAIDRQYAALGHWPGWLTFWFTAVARLTHTEYDLFYLLTLALGVAFTLGWRTRAISIPFAFTVLALEDRAPLLTDGADNVIMLMAIYLVFTACGEHCSLDARRARRRAARGRDRDSSGRKRRPRPAWRVELALARRQMATVLHNGAVLVIAAQVCVIYGTAGLLKVQGSMWQNGSALGYVLRLHWFQPWPGLSDWIAGHSMLLALAGYGTVFLQIGFPFMIFSPRLKYPALAALVMMHVSIAVLLGLPFFSAAMIVGDAVFISDRVWIAAAAALRGPAYARNMADQATEAEAEDAAEAAETAAAATAGTGPAAPAAAAGPASVRLPVLVFDGDCGFCTSSVRWAEKHCRPAVEFVPWQRIDDLAAVGLTEAMVTRSVQWIPAGRSGVVRSGAAAAGRTLLRSRWPWRPIGALMLVPPISWLAAIAYRLIAANRYRLPGGTPACAVRRDG